MLLFRQLSCKIICWKLLYFFRLIYWLPTVNFVLTLILSLGLKIQLILKIQLLVWRHHKYENADPLSGHPMSPILRSSSPDCNSFKTPMIMKLDAVKGFRLEFILCLLNFSAKPASVRNGNPSSGHQAPPSGGWRVEIRIAPTRWPPVKHQRHLAEIPGNQYRRK